MNQTKAIMNAVESLITFTCFFAVTSFFPSGGILTQNGHLTGFWVIPIIFFGGFIVLEKTSEQGIEIPWWIAPICSGLLNGTWLGLSFGAVLILNEWYANPDDGKLEPLFTATGLSSAGVLAVERLLKKMPKKEQDG